MTLKIDCEMNRVPKKTKIKFEKNVAYALY